MANGSTTFKTAQAQTGNSGRTDTAATAGTQTSISNREVTGQLQRLPATDSTNSTTTGRKSTVDSTAAQAAKASSTLSSVVPQMNTSGQGASYVYPVVPGQDDPGKPISFPKGLPESYFIMLEFGKYDRDVALKEATIQTDWSVAFPIPANLVDTTQLTYNNVAFGPLGGEALNATLNILENPDHFAQAKKEVSSGIRALMGNNPSLRQVILRKIASEVSPALGSAFDIAIGATPNPHLAVAFSQVNLRTFNFSWRFSPNNADESASIRDIIKKIQSRILPSKDSSNLLLRFPNYCRIKLMPNSLNNIFKFKPCVVESLNVNYAPNGVPSFFQGNENLPTDMEVSMTFKEVQLRTAEDYK